MIDPIYLFLSFLGGIVSFLGPCHLILIPVYLSYILANDESNIKKGLIGGIMYTLGLSISFSIYNLLLQIIPESFYYFPLFRVIAGIIIISIGSYLVINRDFFTSKFSRMSIFSHLTSNFHILGLLMFGIVSGIAWIPCLTPILTVILAMISINQEFLWGYILLFIYALGLGLPYIIMGTFGIQIKSVTLAKWVKYGMIIQKILSIILIVLGFFILIDGISIWLIII